ncbi:fimbrial biogenesis outer membrane usher protein [Escherichia coli]|nr:fimbrial biogenesis outer membrane usher protein [Escherichia coli]
MKLKVRNLIFVTTPCILSIMISFCAQAYFDPSMLAILDGENSDIDLSPFEKGDSIIEGDYLVDVFVNNEKVATEKILFKKNNKGKIAPCFTPEMLKNYGVNLPVKNLRYNEFYDDLLDTIPSATYKFTVSQLKLDLSIPQLYIHRQAEGYVNPELWDDGVPAMMFNYNIDGGERWQDRSHMSAAEKTNNLFMSVNGGGNIGPWRLRTNWYYSYNTDKQYWGTRKEINHLFSSTHIDRALHRLRADLTVGETSSGGDIFDGIPFRGGRLKSDVDMLPPSLQGFSPVVSGIAKTNALVTISQHGNIIYQTSVAPGPFRIDDLYQAGVAGDLIVTVKESDGSEHISTQSYSALPVMLRSGSYRYEISAGRFNTGASSGTEDTPLFAMGTLAYGLPHYTTLYGGLLKAKNYESTVLGSGLSLGRLGALSFDGTSATATLSDKRKRMRGNSFRLKYSKSMLSTGTTIDLTSYRYSDRRYYTFNEVNSMGMRSYDSFYDRDSFHKRSTWQANISQSLGTIGALSLQGIWSDYWGNYAHKQNTLNVNFSSYINKISYNISYSIDHLKGKVSYPVNKQLAFNISVPLSFFTTSKSAQGVNLGYSINMSNINRNVVHQVTASGTFTNNTSWNINHSLGNKDEESGSLSVDYNSENYNAGGEYNYDINSRGINGHIAGSILLHSHGILLSHYTGDTMALVSVPGVAGVKITPGDGVTDSQGYALVPYMRVYQKNTISLDPSTLPKHVDIIQNSKNVFPTQGAVVLAKFNPKIGQQVFMKLNFHGKPVPFGSVVSVIGDNNSSIVGDDGIVYLSGLQERGIIKVRWGDNTNQHCKVSFNLSKGNIDLDDINQVDAECLND